MPANHKLSKLQGLIATEDGEVLHSGIVTVQAKRHRFAQDYMSFFLDGFESLALMTRPRVDGDGKPQAKLGVEALGVMFYCLSRLTTKNEVDVRVYTEIAEALGIQSAGVSRALKALCEAGIFTKEPDGRLILSPSFGWRGKVSEHKKAVTDKVMKDVVSAISDEKAKV